VFNWIYFGVHILPVLSFNEQILGHSLLDWILQSDLPIIKDIFKKSIQHDWKQ